MTSGSNDIGEAFTGLDAKFGTSFKSSEEDEVINVLEDLKKEIDTVKAKKNSIVDTSIAMVMPDQEYLRAELKGMILSTQTVAKKLENDIKIGTHPRAHEVYAKVVQSITDLVRELRELNESIINIKTKTGANDNNISNKKIALTGDQLLDMIEKAKKSSQINAVVADFTVDEKEDLK